MNTTSEGLSAFDAAHRATLAAEGRYKENAAIGAALLEALIKQGQIASPGAQRWLEERRQMRAAWDDAVEQLQAVVA